jgi:hypothetical protein
MAATSETRNWNTLLSTTLANYRPVLHDNIFNDNVVLYWLTQNERKRTEDGGHRIEETLMYAQNETAKNYSGYEVLDTTPQEGMTKAFYDWKQAAVSITISRREERQNSGKGRLLNLLQAKTIQAELTLKDLMNQQLIGDTTDAASQNWGGTVNPNFFSGFARLAQKTQGAYDIGGIDQSTEAWWQNPEVDYATVYGTWADDGITAMRTMYNNCSKGNDHPDFLLGDQGTYEGYEGLLDDNIRYMDTRYGDAGFINLRFKGAVFTYDEWFASMSTPQIFASSLGVIFFMNSKYVEWVVDKMTDFITTPFVRPTNQDARTAQILVMGELCSTNRRRLGILWNTSPT